jgi:hypothetical protein
MPVLLRFRSMDEREKQREEFVTVARYRDLSEAIVAKTLLESAGIEAWVRDENVVRMEWQYSNLLGGIRLQVKSVDKAPAEELLEQPVPGTISFGEGEEFVQPQCPRCGSIEITYEGAERRAALLSVSLLAVPLPRGRTSWTCHSCGARWENTEDEASEEIRPLLRREPERSALPGFASTLMTGAVPALIAMGFLYAAGREGSAALVRWGGLVLSGVALGLGWRWMAGTAITRWVGAYLAICTAFFAVLAAFGFAVEFVWVGMPVVILTFAAGLYDLFVWQPHKGRFARARAERRGMPE